MDRSILVLSFLTLCFSFQLSKEQESTNEVQREENFQTRRVYYSSEENVCRNRESIHFWPTEVHYEITFEDGRAKVTGSDILGGVVCDDSYFSLDPIYVMHSFQYINEDCPFSPSRIMECDQVVFVQKSIKSRPFGKLVGVWVKITGVQSARFKKEYFDCVIKGDGTIQHFQVEGVYPPPLFKAHCTLNETKTAEMAKSEIKVE